MATLEENIFCPFCKCPKMLLAKKGEPLCRRCRKKLGGAKRTMGKEDTRIVVTWQAFLEQNPSNGELVCIIRSAPDEYKAKASEQLLKQNPSNVMLCDIILFAPEEYKAKAWERLLEQNPGNAMLGDIICWAPDEYKAKASKRLLEQNPSNDELGDIIRFAPEEYKDKAREIINLRSQLKGKSKTELMAMITHMQS